MSYRDDRPDPPLCWCGEAAVYFEALFGAFMCPRRHLFDADLKQFRSCWLAGPEHLDPRPPTPTPTWRERLRDWLM